MSKILEFQALEKKIAADTARFEKLRTELEGVGALAEHIRNEAERMGLDPFEICLAVVPDLEKRLRKADSLATGKQPQTRQRKVKRYENPHTNEYIETKGGNNKTLKEWRQKWPNEVDSWATIIE